MNTIFKHTAILISILGLISSCQSTTQEKSNDKKTKVIKETKYTPRKYDRYDLSKYEKTDNTEKLALMEQVKTFYPQFSEMDSWPDCCSDNFHFIDIDLDGDKDLIFDGWSGGEPMMVEILINMDSVFLSKFRDFINLIDIKFENGLLSELIIHDPGCCAAIMEHDIKYKFKTTNDSIDYWITEYIQYHNETTKPKEYFNNPIEFEVVNTPYTLRITPSIDTVSWFFPDDSEDSKGNVLLQYSKGDKGYAFAEKSDSTGRVWWYVIMDSKKKNERKIKNRNDFEPEMKGWMSSRYLNKK